MLFLSWDAYSCILHICVKKADGQVWESHQIHQRNPEQQSNPRSTLEWNYMAGKWSWTFGLFYPLQGHLHPHVLQGAPEFRALGQIPARAPTAKSLTSAHDSTSPVRSLQPPFLDGRRYLTKKRPRHLRGWYPEIHSQIMVFNSQIFPSIQAYDSLLLLTSWIKKTHFLSAFIAPTGLYWW